MLSGLLLEGLVIWRILWGFMGSKYARFSEFALNPIDLKNYLIGIFAGSKKRWLGHNPASSWATVTLISLALGLVTTGYLMSTGKKETFEDTHEFIANMFAIVVVLHIFGVTLHSIQHWDFIALSIYLFNNFDSQKGTLKVFGEYVQLGESKGKFERLYNDYSH